MLRSLLLFLALVSFSRHSTADPRTTLAGNFCTPTYAVSGSLFAYYFVPAMDNVSMLVSQNGFGTTSFGSAPNAVFALGQCLEDLDSVDCKLCFSEIRSQLPKCYPRTGGRMFLDGCFGRYENFSFFDEFSGPEDTSVCGRNRSNWKQFGVVLREVLGNVTANAKANKGYAVGTSSAAGTSVYALAQCWENLNGSRCGACLDNAEASVIGCAPATEGRALFTGCFMRYSTTLFWNSYATASGSSGGKNDLAWILSVSLVGVILLIAGIIVWRMKCFCNKRNPSYFEDFYPPGLSAVIAQSNLHFRYEEVKKATNSFNPSNKLGQGSYGTVYKGVLSDGREVAVKRLLLNTRQWIDQFVNEVNLVNQVRHKNLVKLLGYSVDGPESLLIYEYFYNKSLDHFIFDATHNKYLNWDQRCEIIQGVAEGLAYLHEESETRIIHRDIKASNILLDEKLKPKITDFGLARSFPEDQTHLSTGIAGTLGYMAPEYIVHGHLTEKADVYSFGILILEIISGQRCSGTIGPRAGQSLLTKVWNHYKAGTLHEIIEEGIYAEVVKDEILHVVKTGLLCTQANPRDRSTMVKVVELLRNNKEGDFILTDPAFLDLAIENVEEGEALYLLSNNSVPSLSRSSDVWMSGR